MTDTKTTTIPTAIATRISILLSDIDAGRGTQRHAFEAARALGPLLVEAIEASTAPTTAITDSDPPLAYRLYVDGEHVASRLAHQIPGIGETIISDSDGGHLRVADVRWRGATMADLITTTCPGWTPEAGDF
jgi:hypothetical protein